MFNHPNILFYRATFLTLLTLLASPGNSTVVELDFDPNNFPLVPVIDNPYLPQPVGAVFYYRAQTEDECEFIKTEVTTDTYTVAAGVTARVIRDQSWVTDVDDDDNCDIGSAALEEDTKDYLAQDNAPMGGGNVWYLGEDTINEECSTEGSWEAGVGEAEAGILMLAHPMSGDRYRQEFLEDEAEDWAKVKVLNARVSIESGDYSDCLITKEWTPLEPGHVEHKYYCLTKDDAATEDGLVFIKEFMGKTLNVEQIPFAQFPVGLPGDGVPFPALGALGCL